MARTTSEDFSNVRIHDNELAARSVADVGATAWTVGEHIAFGRGSFRPCTPGGDRLIAHELAHVVQQRRTGVPVLARSVDDWLQSTPSLSAMSYTGLVLEADELQQWLGRQTSSSAETSRIEEVLPQIRREIARRDAEAVAAGRMPARKTRRRTTAPPARLPDRRPQILTRMSSVSYTDPAEMRAEYDLIMQWLAMPQLAREERRILETERANLSGLLQGERQRQAGQRQAARLTLALTPSQSDQGSQLGSLANIIEGIVGDQGNPELFWLYDRGERIPISRAQRDSLHTTLHDQLAGARSQMSSSVDYYWGRYRSQREVNDEFPIVSAISGWLGGVHDPGAELARRRMVAIAHLETLRAHINAGRLREAGAMLASLERETQIIRAVSRAFYEGYIDGAETAVTVLEITRDVSFAVATSIGAVVAAPFVAGLVAGAGITGTAATGLTIVGTGTLVGSGAGLVRGGSAALGVGVAGGSADEALATFRSEGTRGFVDGFVAGAGGSAARALAPALGVGAQVGQQALRRIATQAIVNSGAAVIDALANGATIEQAAQRGLTAALLSVPGAAIGSDSRLSRMLLGPLVNSGTAYVGALANGASPDSARRAAIVALTAGLATGGIIEGRTGELAGYERAGRDVGGSIRSTVVSTTAALMIGVSNAVPPARTVGGDTVSISTSIETNSTTTSAAPATTVTAPAQVVAPAQTTAATQMAAVPTAPATTPATTTTAVTTPAPATTPAATQASIGSATFATTVAPVIAQQPAAPATTTATAPSTTTAQQQAVVQQRRESTGARGTARASSSAQAALQAQAQMGFIDPALAAPGANVATASAQTPRSITTAIRSQTGEVTAYDARLNRGEIGVIAPSGSNIPGPDYATAVRLPNGDYEIVVPDAKSRVSGTSAFGQVRNSLPVTWQNEITNALAPGRLNLGDPVLEQALRDAWAQGRVRIARDTIDYSEQGQGQLRLDN